MGFATGKAVVLGTAVTVGMAAGLYFLRPGIDLVGLALQAAVTGSISGAAFGWLMRSQSVELPGQSIEQIESALGSTIQLRGFKRIDGAGSEVIFERGKGGAFGDRLVVTPTATGVTLSGPANLIRVISKRAAV